jgi:type IV secretory pathway VirB2 component (pilin)
MKECCIKQKIKRFFALVSLALSGIPLYAAYEMPGQLTDAADSIKTIITGPFVKTLLIIFLCASAIAYAFNKDNEKVKRNCIAVFIGAVIVIAATSIMGVVWDNA